MLHKIIIENFKSFGTKGEISLYANPKRTVYPSHIYSGEELLYPVLKHCLIVGTNASGKTNIVSALRFIKEFCGGQQHHDPKDEFLRHWYYQNRFCLPVAEDEAPIHFLVEFSKGGRYYEYSVSFDGEGIKSEALYLARGNRLRPQIIFLRTRDRVEFQRELNVDNDTVARLQEQMEYNPETSILVLNANLRYVENRDMLNAQAWFCENLEVAKEEMSEPELLDFYCNNPRTLEFTNSIMKKIGLGCTVAIAESKPSEWLKRNARCMDRNILSLFENGEISPAIHSYDSTDMVIRTVGRRKVIREMEFVHSGINGFEMRTRAIEESKGTIRLLTILAILYRTIHEGRTFIVDDIEQNLNAATFRDLMKYYCETEGFGQLIYTTNSLMTMNQQEMTRLDEVNLLEKKDGSTQVCPLDKFPNIKIFLSLERNYLDGRFGCRPGMILEEEEPAE